MHILSVTFIVFGLLSFSCSEVQPISNNEQGQIAQQQDSNGYSFDFVDPDGDIDDALHALTEIQVNGDGGMMLYLTFPNISHRECSGAVSTFEITRKEFHDALMDVMNKNNTIFSDKKRAELAKTALKPADHYTVKTCGATTESIELTDGEIPPRKGTWVISEIFGVSDLLINW